MVSVQLDGILEQEILLSALSEYANLEHNFGNHARGNAVMALKEKIVKQLPW